MLFCTINTQSFYRVLVYKPKRFHKKIDLKFLKSYWYSPAVFYQAKLSQAECGGGLHSLHTCWYMCTHRKMRFAAPAFTWQMIALGCSPRLFLSQAKVSGQNNTLTRHISNINTSSWWVVISVYKGSTLVVSSMKSRLLLSITSRAESHKMSE